MRCEEVVSKTCAIKVMERWYIGMGVGDGGDDL